MLTEPVYHPAASWRGMYPKERINCTLNAKASTNGGFDRVESERWSRLCIQVLVQQSHYFVIFIFIYVGCPCWYNLPQCSLRIPKTLKKLFLFNRIFCFKSSQHSL